MRTQGEENVKEEDMRTKEEDAEEQRDDEMLDGG